MRIRTTLVTIVSLLALVLVLAALPGCGSASPPPSGGAPASDASSTAGASKNVAISIASFAFEPANAEVVAGGTVTWTNNDNVAHTISIDGKVSSEIAPGATFSQVFEKAGTYPYTCSIHPSMTGELTVK